MNLLIDLLHPTEFHFFKPIIEELEKRGNKLVITAREEEVLISLLKRSKLKYSIISSKKKSKIRLIFELFNRTRKLFKISKKERIDLFLGMSTLSTSIVGKFLKIPTILFTECESMGLKTKLVFSLATKIVTPNFFKKKINCKHVKINSLLQLNYIHPNYFKPNKELIEKKLDIDLENEKYFILRFCDWSASHDIKQKGFSSDLKRKIVNRLQQDGRVFIFDEKNEEEFQKYRVPIAKDEIFHLLAFSSLTVTETTSISIESALLGVPVVRCTTLVDTRMGGAAIFKVLEDNDLVYNYSDEYDAYSKIIFLLENSRSLDERILRRNQFVEQFEKDSREVILKLICEELNLKKSCI